MLTWRFESASRRMTNPQHLFLETISEIEKGTDKVKISQEAIQEAGIETTKGLVIRPAEEKIE